MSENKEMLEYEALVRNATDDELVMHHETMLSGWARHRNTCEILRNAAERDLKIINAEIKRREI